MNNKKRIAIVVTVPITFYFLYRGQIKYLKSQGFEVIAICSPGKELAEVKKRDEIQVQAVSMIRGFSPVADLISLVKLFLLFRKIRPDIVHGSTPKGGLLSMMAAVMARVPVKIYTIRGLLITERKGWMKSVLLITEHLACYCADKVFCVSFGIREVTIKEKICKKEKITVLQKGSSNGVDTERFNEEIINEEKKDEFRKKYGLNIRMFVIGFIGRIVKDKGINELLEAWEIIKKEFQDTHLLLVGPFEDQDAIDEKDKKRIQSDPKVHLTGMISDVETAYATMNIVVLPSYREGFANVPLEAASMKIPVVATKIAGCKEAVVDGVTGILVQPKDVKGLYEAIKKLLNDSELRKNMGEKGRERVVRDFQPEKIWENLCIEYNSMMVKKGIGIRDSAH